MTTKVTIGTSTYHFDSFTPEEIMGQCSACDYHKVDPHGTIACKACADAEKAATKERGTQMYTIVTKIEEKKG